MRSSVLAENCDAHVTNPDAQDSRIAIKEYFDIRSSCSEISVDAVLRYKVTMFCAISSTCTGYKL